MATHSVVVTASLVQECLQLLSESNHWRQRTEYMSTQFTSTANTTICLLAGHRKRQGYVYLDKFWLQTKYVGQMVMMPHVNITDVLITEENGQLNDKHVFFMNTWKHQMEAISTFTSPQQFMTSIPNLSTTSSHRQQQHVAGTRDRPSLCIHTRWDAARCIGNRALQHCQARHG